MQNPGVRIGIVEPGGVELEFSQVLYSLFGLLLLPHAGPNIGIKEVGSPARLYGISHKLHRSTRNTGSPDTFRNEARVRVVPFRARQGKIDPCHGAPDDQAVGYVVPITQVDDPGASKSISVFLHCLQIGQGLAWVCQVGQGVNDRDTRFPCQDLYGFLGISSYNQGRKIPGKDFCGIAQRFPSGEVDIPGAEENGLSSQLVDPCFEGNAGSRRRFLEQDAHTFAKEWTLGEACSRYFHFNGPIKEER